MARFQGEELIVVLHRLGHPVGLMQHLRPPETGQRKARIRRQRPFVAGQGFRIPAGETEREAVIIPARRVGGLEGRHFFVTRDGIVQPVPGFQATGQIFPALDKIRPHLQGVAEMFLRLLHAPGSLQRQGQTHFAHGVARAGPVRPAEQIDGLWQTPLLIGDQTGEMQRIEILGPRGPQPPINDLGFPEAVGPVVRHRLLQLGLELCQGHISRQQDSPPIDCVCTRSDKMRR